MNKIRTQFLYPDGEVIDLWLDHEMISDIGETMRWLRNQNIIAEKRTEKQDELIRRACEEYGISLINGAFVRAFLPGETTEDGLRRAALGVQTVALTLEVASAVQYVTATLEKAK